MGSAAVGTRAMGPPTERVGPLAQIETDLETQRSRIVELAADIERSIDQIVGVEPPEADSPTETPMEGSTLGRMGDNIRIIDRSISKIRTHFERL